jgi:hypothetical protein
MELILTSSSQEGVLGGKRMMENEIKVIEEQE